MNDIPAFEKDYSKLKTFSTKGDTVMAETGKGSTRPEPTHPEPTHSFCI